MGPGYGSLQVIAAAFDVGGTQDGFIEMLCRPCGERDNREVIVVGHGKLEAGLDQLIEAAYEHHKEHH